MILQYLVLPNPPQHYAADWHMHLAPVVGTTDEPFHFFQMREVGERDSSGVIEFVSTSLSLLLWRERFRIPCEFFARATEKWRERERGKLGGSQPATILWKRQDDTARREREREKEQKLDFNFRRGGEKPRPKNSRF